VDYLLAGILILTADTSTYNEWGIKKW